jgi:uncharacterized protein YyaL (SSP411 family)
MASGHPSDPTDPTTTDLTTTDSPDGEVSAAGSHGPANRLAHESSPYLLLHAHNPVDWYPWGAEAIARARAEDKPLFVSVGYATCYWCHVMERESFANPEIAALMNRAFVNVKVDREERPDVDEIYMAATQILTSQGGWPNSVFLTPDLRPFYAGTYFPPVDRHGRPGFGTLVIAIADAWANRRDDVLMQAEELAEVIGRYLEQSGGPDGHDHGDHVHDGHAHEHGPGCGHDHGHGEGDGGHDHDHGHTHAPSALPTAPPSPEVARLARDRSLELLGRRFDPTWGGFGIAPKFPTASNLFLLLDSGQAGLTSPMLQTTLDRMLRGGIYDQLAGGFHRYSTDREWRVPHFEKMLYDQGLLLEVYARYHAATGDLEAARVVRETAQFLAAEMTSPEGALWSAIDAEVDGHEGAFHVWTRQQLATVLPAEDFAFAAPLLGFDGAPFFEPHQPGGGAYVLHLPAPLAEEASRRRTSGEALLAEFAPLRARLLAARAARKHPATDDKVLTDWNGLAIAGLAIAGKALAAPELVAQAARAADFVLTHLRAADGTLLHTWRAVGRPHAKIPAFLGDYAFLLHGLLALDAAESGGASSVAPSEAAAHSPVIPSGAPASAGAQSRDLDLPAAIHRRSSRWLTAAGDLAREMLRRLTDDRGGLYLAAASPDLLARSRDYLDGALPSSYGTAVLALLTLAERTADPVFLTAAHRALTVAGRQVETQPEGCRTLVRALVRYHQVAAAAAPEATTPTAVIHRDLGALLGRPVGGPPSPAAVLTAAVDLAASAPGTDWRVFSLHVAVAPGWHVYAPTVGEAAAVVAPITIIGQGCSVRSLVMPVATALPDAEPPVDVYAGGFTMTGELAVDTAPATLRIRYQACDDHRCLAPAEVVVPID